MWLLDKLEPGDDVMADRGFTIRGLLALIGCTLNMPPLTKGKPISEKETTKTRRIARARIHVERAIGRLENFKILSGVIPLTLKYSIEQIIVVCAAICNSYSSIVRQ